MSIPKGINRDDVLAALADLDRGIEHGFGAPTKFELLHAGRRYPPKAAVGLAARRVAGRTLTPDDFSSGEQPSQAVGLLRGLGFEVAPIDQSAPSPTQFIVGDKYTRRQVQQTVGLTPARGGPWDTGYVRHGGEWFLFPTVGGPSASGFDYHNHWVDEGLHWSAKKGAHAAQPSMRQMLANDAVVHLFAREGPRESFEYFGVVTPARTLPGATALEVIWRLPQGSLPIASRSSIPEEVDPGHLYPEGAVKSITVNAYERSREARSACIGRWGYTCAACGLTLSSTYGEAAAKTIHVHHLRPLASVGSGYKVNPIDDLRPVCPNCHAVIHSRIPMYSLEEVQLMLRRE